MGGCGVAGASVAGGEVFVVAHHLVQDAVAEHGLGGEVFEQVSVAVDHLQVALQG